MARRKKKPTEVKTTTHQEKRVNIPTQEMSDYMTDEQRQPRPVLYPRRPELDPQLVWQGKDAQDSEPLEVWSKPIYTQEKIHPLAIIDNVKAQAKRPPPAEPQMSLFADFNGIEFENQIDFYNHQQNWTNRMILGDSLQVMTSLNDREGLKGQVQMIYIDPPYGIKFGSNWQVSTRDRSVKDSAAGLSRQPEQVKAFRDTWELGIHSYLAYLRDRLQVARELLTETGSVFVQIGDENVHLVRCLLDEVFGSGNFVSAIIFEKTSSSSTNTLSNICDYVLWYAKNSETVKYRQIYAEKILGEKGTTQYIWLESSDGYNERRMTRDEILTPSKISDGWKVFACDNLTSQRPPQGVDVTKFQFQGSEFSPGRGTFKTDRYGLDKLASVGRLKAIGNSLMYKRYLSDFLVSPIANIWTDVKATGFTEEKLYVVQTSVKAIQRCLLMTTDPGDLVLDPTCGSGTTAYVAEQWGRRWITTDTSRVALALARTRLMAARFPYYELADPEGEDLRLGFNYKTVPHITLRDIANNPEIDDIHAKWQETLEPLRGRLNELLNQSWEEWEIPRELPEDTKLPPLQRNEAEKLLADWWQARQARQAEIDESIARNSDQETLYDQPEEVRHVVRVTGPFTTESLSPFKPISPEAAASLPQAEQEAKQQDNAGKFESQILDNLREAGVQNTIADERIEFELLEAWDGGIYIQATGEYTDSQENLKRVAVAIGPEHGTVGREFIKEAANEAIRHMRPQADLLLVCAFSFDGEASEEAKRWGRLTVLPVRMNPDLTMASLLKKTKKANLFTVFGEPDMTVDETDNGQIKVSIKGLDIYDPTTGEIRSSSPKEIACWFIDTDYNGQSFFVRHAYFTGADKPYDKLQRALKAEINKDAWQTLYRTESMPFDAPASGKIAVKVINHYGDEVLKVHAVR